MADVIGAVEAMKEGIVDNAMTSVNTSINGLIQLAISRAVDFVFTPSTDEKRREMNEYYDRMKEIADHSRYAQIANQPHDPFLGLPPRERVMKELDTVEELALESIANLKKARDMSRCGVCRRDFDIAAKLVEESIAPALDATDKVRAIQILKSQGELPQEAMWETLKRDQKKRVEAIVRDLDEQRISRSGGANGGEEELEEDWEPRAAAPKKAKRKTAPRKTKRSKRKSNRKSH